MGGTRMSDEYALLNRRQPLTFEPECRFFANGFAPREVLSRLIREIFRRCGLASMISAWQAINDMGLENTHCKTRNFDLLRRKISPFGLA